MMCLTCKRLLNITVLLHLENYRLEHKVCKDALDKFLNTYKEYRELKKETIGGCI